MGTRGAFGVFSEGNLKLSYNHWDSYPEGLGKDLVKQIMGLTKRHDQNSLKALALALTQVDGKTPPTKAQIKKLAKWTDTGVSRQSTSDWYCLLRGLQGKLDESLEDAGYMSDGNDFPNDSLFCEWAYVFDIDNMKLEVYQGFQTKPHLKGRFARNPVQPTNMGDVYYPVKLVKTFNVNSRLPATFAKWLAKLEAEAALENAKAEG